MGGLLRFPNINNVVISGRLVRDVDIKHSSNGVTIARMCIAVSKYFRDEFGNFQEQASFVDIVAFNKQAQTCQESLKKGSPVLVEGELKTRTFTDPNQQNRKFTEIIADKVYPLEKDENFVSNFQQQQLNQNYPNQMNPTNQQNQQFPQNATTKQSEPESYQPYNADYVEANTENDVPF